MRTVRVLGIALLLSIMALYGWFRLQVADHQVRLKPLHPTVVIDKGTAVTIPGQHITVAARAYEDELQAYAAFQHLQPALGRHVRPLLTLGGPQRRATIRLEVENDLLLALPAVQRLHAAGVVVDENWMATDPSILSSWNEESALFEDAYSGLAPRLAVPSKAAARWVADVREVAEIFAVPMRLFRPLPQDNWPRSDVHWKIQPNAEDIVLLKSGTRVLTINRSVVGWQEIDEALQHAHALFRSRAYGQLPPRLRPPTHLAYDLPAPVLLTYTGFLLREAVDGAGPNTEAFVRSQYIRPADPTVRQAPGVRRASFRAARVLSHAFQMNRQWITSHRE